MESKKYLGTVKWYGNDVTGGKYGFISNEKLGELFFHKRSINPESISISLEAGQLVSFISEASRKHEGKLEATNIQSLSKETDPEFILTLYLDRLLKTNDITKDSLLVQAQQLYLSIRSRLNSELMKKLMEIYFKHPTTSLASLQPTNMNYLTSRLQTFRLFFPHNYRWYSTFVESKLDPEVGLQLWISKHLFFAPIDYLARTFISLSPNVKTKVLERSTDFEKTSFLLLIADRIMKIDKEPLANIKILLSTLQLYKIDYFHLIFRRFKDSMNTEIYLMLWLEDFHDQLDLQIYKEKFYTLSHTNQQLFVKKLLSKVKMDTWDITKNDFIDLHDKWTDSIHDTNAPSDGTLDYSTGILLYIIKELSKEQTTRSISDARRTQPMIFDLILNNVTDPKDILRISGYFDSCEGRCYPERKEDYDEEENMITSYQLKRNVTNIARNHPICDGRKAISAIDHLPSLDPESGLEYWWCANLKCFAPSRRLHQKSDWKSYSLMDFLHALGIEYSELGLEMYLNTINKTNRFLVHMKCRDCEHILFPKGKSSYAFYGVNHFHCKNQSCLLKEKEIYISHCSNGHCDMSIDSRDSVKCKPQGHEESCGWYICNYCGACCSTPNLERRKYVTEQLMQRTYSCHNIGHKELGVLCCTTCGVAMERKCFSAERYEVVLNWFIAEKDNRKYIKSSGETYSKRWFLYVKGDLSEKKFEEKLKNLRLIGFQVSESRNPNEFFIKERSAAPGHNLNLFTCTNSDCNKILDYSKDAERLAIVKRYHVSAFV